MTSTKPRVPHRRDLWVGCGLLASVIMPLLGYAYLFGAHPGEGDRQPWWVSFVVPASALGPDTPSVGLFAGLALLNALLWFAVGFGVTRSLEAAYRRATNSPDL